MGKSRREHRATMSPVVRRLIRETSTLRLEGVDIVEKYEEIPILWIVPGRGRCEGACYYVMASTSTEAVARVRRGAPYFVTGKPFPFLVKE